MVDMLGECRKTAAKLVFATDPVGPRSHGMPRAHWAAYVTDGGKLQLEHIGIMAANRRTTLMKLWTDQAK